MTLPMFLQAHRAATASAHEIINVIPKEVAFVPLEGRFNPAELVVHLIQSERFALSFLLPAGGYTSEPFQIPSTLEPLLKLYGKDRHRALSDLNLRGAKSLATRFANMEDLRIHWMRLRAKEHLYLSGTKESLLLQEVGHPLVELRAPWILMCYTLFVEHSFYHIGQVAQLLKELEYGHVLPLPFGTMPEVPSK